VSDQTTSRRSKNRKTESFLVWVLLAQHTRERRRRLAWNYEKSSVPAAGFWYPPRAFHSEILWKARMVHQLKWIIILYQIKIMVRKSVFTFRTKNLLELLSVSPLGWLNIQDLRAVWIILLQIMLTVIYSTQKPQFLCSAGFSYFSLWKALGGYYKPASSSEGFS